LFWLKATRLSTQFIKTLLMKSRQRQPLGFLVKLFPTLCPRDLLMLFLDSSALTMSFILLQMLLCKNSLLQLPLTQEFNDQDASMPSETSSPAGHAGPSLPLKYSLTESALPLTATPTLSSLQKTWYLVTEEILDAAVDG